MMIIVSIISLDDKCLYILCLHVYSFISELCDVKLNDEALFQALCSFLVDQVVELIHSPIQLVSYLSGKRYPGPNRSPAFEEAELLVMKSYMHP